MLGHHPYTNVLDGVEEERKEREGGGDVPLEEKDQVSVYNNMCIWLLSFVSKLNSHLYRNQIQTSSPPFP
jgi:hypothetical protein